MASESGTYTPETIARRLKMAESLLSSESPVRHWAQGLNELAKGYVGGTMFKNAEDAEKSGQSAQYAAIANILGGGLGGAGAAPGAAPAPDAPVPSGVGAPLAPDEPIAPKPVPTIPVRQATEGAIVPPVDPYSQDTPRMSLDNPNLGPGRAAIAAALNGPNAVPAILGPSAPQTSPAPAPVAVPPAAVPSPLPPAPTGAMPAPAVTLAGPPAPPTAAGPPPMDARAKIAAMLRDPNPYVRRQAAEFAKSVVAQQLAAPKYSAHVVGDTLYNFDERSGKATPLADVGKPTYHVIGKDNFGNEIYGWTNPRGQSVTPTTLPNQPPADNTITLNNGTTVSVPPGQDPKKFREHVTMAQADAAAGKLTEVQSNALSFGQRMEHATQTLNKTENAGTGFIDKATGAVPFNLGNYVRTPEYQQYSQAKSQFITALLRKESGAAINSAEYERYDREFFPQPGDPANVVKQKRDARTVAIDAMKKAAGPAYVSPPAASPTTGSTEPPPPPAGFVVQQ